MTPYLKLKLHLERHMYKRGMNKGEAPADASRRGKSHFRVIRGNGGQMIVRMYSTDILTVREDNSITIDMRHWWTSTTKANLNEALHTFVGWGGVSSTRYGNYSQLVFAAKGKRYRYYDGISFDAEGNLIGEAKPFTKRVTNRDDTKEFREDMQASGFKDVFPVLFAAAEPNKWWGVSVGRLHVIVTNECHANEWADVAANYKYSYDDHKDALRAITARCTADMKELVDTDVTAI